MIDRGRARGGLASVAVLLAFAGTASADDAQNRGVYLGGMVGVGFARSGSGGDSFSSFLPYGSPGPSSTGTAEAGPSVSLILGKDWRMSNQFSAGLEFEASYQAAHGASTGRAYFASAPTAGSEVTQDDHASSQWSVPAQVALRARVAFQVTPSVSVFGSLGPALGYAHIQTSSSEHVSGFFVERGTFQVISLDNTYAASGSRWVVDPGLSFDAGVDVAVSDSVSLRGEYALAAFQSVSHTIFDAAASTSITAKAAPVFQGFRLGLVKHF